MSQTYPTVTANDIVADSRQKLLDRDDSIRSCFSATQFPTGPVVGQLCYRTDQSVLYQCKAVDPDRWEPLSAGLLAGLIIDPNASGTVETVIATHDLGTNTWDGNKRVVRITALALAADNANAKQIKLYFGATEIAASQPDESPRNVPLSIDAVIVKKTANTQVARAIFMGKGAFDMEQFLTEPAEDLAQSVTVSVAAVGGEAGDIVLKWFQVEVIG